MIIESADELGGTTALSDGRVWLPVNGGPENTERGVPRQIVVNRRGRRFLDEALPYNGENAYDDYYGDPWQPGNRCLGPIDRPPYYAMRVYSGVIGSKGGPVTDTRGRVLARGGSVLPGLYAVGNPTVRTNLIKLGLQAPTGYFSRDHHSRHRTTILQNHVNNPRYVVPHRSRGGIDWI